MPFSVFTMYERGYSSFSSTLPFILHLFSERICIESPGLSTVSSRTKVVGESFVPVLVVSVGQCGAESASHLLGGISK